MTGSVTWESHRILGMTEPSRDDDVDLAPSLRPHGAYSTNPHEAAQRQRRCGFTCSG